MRKKPKRILFVTPPGYGHVFPMVPLAWALRAFGHQVLVGTCGVSISASTRAGLSAANVAPGANLQAVFQRFRNDYQDTFYDPDLSPEERGSTDQPSDTFFTAIGDLMLEGVVNLLDAWHPDVIVYTPYAAAAPIAASKYAIPTVFLGIAIAYVPRAMFEGTYSRMVSSSQRHGVVAVSAPSFWIDISPPSLRKAPADGLLMRPTLYTGAELIDGKPVCRKSRPQVAVTLGTVVPLAEGLRSLRWLVEAAPQVQAEFVIAHGSTDAGDLGALPPNVRTSSWIGLDRLLPDSAAVIHHGGPGTMFAALDQGLPQVVLPRGSDQFYNAEALRRRGVALVPDEQSLDASTITRLLTDGSLRAAAEAVSKEIRDMPTPGDIAPRVAALAG